MKIKNISYPTPLSKVKNDNVDVFVELDDGITYVVVVCTLKDIEWSMNEDNLNYVKNPVPFIIVRKLTEDNIRKALEEYAKDDDAYWIKFYSLVGGRSRCFSLKSLNESIKEIEKENREIFGDLYE